MWEVNKAAVVSVFDFLPTFMPISHIGLYDDVTHWPFMMMSHIGLFMMISHVVSTCFVVFST